MILDEFLLDHCERWAKNSLPTSEWQTTPKQLADFLRSNPDWLERDFTWWQVYDAMREPITRDWQDTSKQVEAV